MSNNLKKQSTIYFKHLDVIRFFAAFMIIILHSYEAWNSWFDNGTNHVVKELFFFSGYINQFIKNLNIGVDVFFLLSGFLITYILIQEKSRFKTIHIWKFIVRRTLRIWPLYFLLILTAPFLVNLLGTKSPNYLANIFFVGNFDIMHSKSWAYPFAHFWSIAVEEHFYLIWPFILYLIPNKHLLKSFFIILSLSIFYRLYTALTVEHYSFHILLHTMSRIDVMVIGGIGAYFYSKKPFTIHLSRPIRILLFSSLLILLSIEPYQTWNTVYLAGFKKYIYIGLISILLIDYNFNPNFKHILPKKSFIHYLGRISYGIYMYGNILLLYVIKQIMWKFHITNMWAFFAITITLSILIPIISYELFEKQILKLNKRFRVVQTER